MSSSSCASGTPLGSSSSARDGNNNFANGAENMLKLALKKPKAWKWELTTSSSSPGIDFPKIQLFDSRTGELMIQVDKPDCVVKSEQLENGGSSDRSRSSTSEKKGKDQRYRRSRSSCIREKVVTSGEYLSDVFEQLQNKGLGYKLATSASQYRVQDEEEEDRSLQKSKSANEVNGVKKKIRKSTSSRSSSILGKISEFYKSSTEEEPIVVSPPPPPPAPPTPPPVIPEITVVEEPPAPEPPKNKIYKLVRSNVGTLIVREESFHTQRSLRRRKLESENSIPEDEPRLDQRIILPTDIPTPSYDTTINEIDKLISKVMLSHTLQSVEEAPKHSSPVRVKHEHGKKRRSRRSASAGSAASRSASAGSRARGRNSPRVTVLPGSSSSEEEDAVSLAESRFGSLKRRGRPKYRRHVTPAAAAVVPAEENTVERSKEQETNAARSTSLRIEECSSTLSKSSSSGTSRSRSKSSSTSVSTLSPPSEVGETSTLQNLDSIGSSEPRQASIATLPEVHYERLNSIEQTAQVTEILNPRGTSEASAAPAEKPPQPKPEVASPTNPRRSKLHPDTFFNSYLAELRSLSLSAQQSTTATTSNISQTPELRRNHLATSQSASSLVQPVKQKQYGRRHHRSSYLQLLP